MAIQKSDGFIIRKIPFRETSWIVTCFTRHFGKVKGIVKGARKAKSPWHSSCEPWTHAMIIFFEKTRTHLHLFTDFSVLKSHEKLRSNFAALTYAGYFSELLDQLLEESEPQPVIFEMLEVLVQLLEGKKRSLELEMIARVFEVKLLAELGLLPRLDSCVECQGSFELKAYFSAQYGGTFCRGCFLKRRSGFEISQGSLKAIQFVLTSDFERAAGLKLGPQMRKETERLLQQFIQFRLDHQMKSLRFMSQVSPVISRN